MKEKIILLISLVILILSPMIAQAEDCEAGSGDSKWTVYTGNHIILLKGDVCRFDKVNLQWKGVDLQGNKTFFHGAFILRGGHHAGSKVFKKTLKKNDPRVSW